MPRDPIDREWQEELEFWRFEEQFNLEAQFLVIAPPAERRAILRKWERRTRRGLSTLRARRDIMRLKREPTTLLDEDIADCERALLNIQDLWKFCRSDDAS